jgi:hypothetical protein
MRVVHSGRHGSPALEACALAVGAALPQPVDSSQAAACASGAAQAARARGSVSPRVTQQRHITHCCRRGRACGVSRRARRDGKSAPAHAALGEGRPRVRVSARIASMPVPGGSGDQPAHALGDPPRSRGARAVAVPRIMLSLRPTCAIRVPAGRTARREPAGNYHPSLHCRSKTRQPAGLGRDGHLPRQRGRGAGARLAGCGGARARPCALHHRRHQRAEAHTPAE